MQAAGERSIILKDGGRCVRQDIQRVLQSSTGCAGLLYKVSQPPYKAPLSYPNDTRGFHRAALQSATPRTSHTKENDE
jgi:hypothetical protein